ncbi:MarR family winged helix-turn-helix transcriptional regulator [Microvirga terrestris]|uniref:MarR family winged helix-turn-helix transcriptional regulator n=1 Tax=Microvirga terrestris TaxID=2791024 RepID=UPI003CCF1464
MPDALPALKSHHLGKDILAETPAYDLIELFFFAYRDFVSDPDRILDEYGFGRAHHRVLHFVSRNPGLTIAELLDILRITKQSLNRVLKELIEKDFIESRMGTSDRRQRLLFATIQGRELALKLAKLQTRRIMRALSGMEPEAKDAVSRYLLSLIDPDESAHVKQLVFGSGET